MIKFRELLPLYAVIFLGFFGYALTITLFIPMLMDKNFLLLPTNASIGIRASLSGLLLAMYPLGQFFGSPVIGHLSDHFGRKKVLLYSLIACILGFVGMALSIHAHQLTWLFISSLLTGLCESNMAISQSIIADRATDSVQKTKLIGYAYSACSLGYIVGPLLGGASASSWGYSAPFWITALGVLALVWWVFYSLEDGFVTLKSHAVSIVKSLTAISSIFNDRKLYKIYWINFLIFFAVQGCYRVIPLYITDEWQPSLHTYSILIAFASLICFIANLFLLGHLAQRFSTVKLLKGLLLAGGVFIILVVIPSQFNWIWLTFALATMPTVMALPTCTVWLSTQVDLDKQGQVLGNNQALLVLGEAASAAIGGVIAAIHIALPVVMMGLILLVTSMLVAKLRT